MTAEPLGDFLAAMLDAEAVAPNDLEPQPEAPYVDETLRRQTGPPVWTSGMWTSGMWTSSRLRRQTLRPWTSWIA